MILSFKKDAKIARSLELSRVESFRKLFVYFALSERSRFSRCHRITSTTQIQRRKAGKSVWHIAEHDIAGIRLSLLHYKVKVLLIIRRV
jgi:hypothetical protein